MKRLLATIRWDIQLQYRNGFYYAAAVVVVLWAALLSQAPGRGNLAWLLPALVLNNVLINAFYFIGGLVLLEKGEGTLEAQVVTPLRAGEYLVAKVITLTLLSLVENLVIVSLTVGLRFHIFPLVAGVVLSAAIFSLVGFVAVARYDSINEYLFPSMLYATLLLLPLFPYVGIGESWWFYPHPVQAALVLLQATFQPVSAWQIVYGLLYAALWLGLCFGASRRAFYRFVIAREGVRRAGARS